MPYNSCVTKVTTLSRGTQSSEAGGSVDRIEVALQVVARSITQVRLHERLLQAAGVRLDAPTVTRKIQQLERDGLVGREPDPDDGRATRIHLTPAGKRTLERVLKARRQWLDRLLRDWKEGDLEAFATLLGRFSDDLSKEIGDSRGY